MRKKTVLAIGRWMPIHLGHKQFLINLAKEFDTVIVGIGSCYENGTLRNCIPATEREKLLRTIFRKEGHSNFEIVHVPDRPSFEEWFNDIVELCKSYHVTHFCTGNKEDILDVMKEKNLQLDVELINPEDTSNFPYHATDIRNAILNKEFEKLDSMIPAEIKEPVLNQVAKEIRMANEGKGQEFIPGRQTVDMVFIVNDQSKGNRYLLIGKRNESKIDFPGYYAIPGGGIKEFESPTDAVLRCFEAETGIKIKLTDNCTEPAEITLCNIQEKPSRLYFTGIYSSHDESINGTLGGGSQCFAIVADENIENIESVLHSTHDMTELLFVPLDDIYKIDFAYDQKRMIYNAIAHLNLPCDKGELLQKFDDSGNPVNEPASRFSAHRNGIPHGASHTFLYKFENNELYILFQRRSYNKDSYPGYLDVSSAGHIEFGSDFEETAIKELSEELGLNVDRNELEELFDQKIFNHAEFHGQAFIDNEFNKVYALQTGCDISELKFQPEEVAGAVWLSAEKILEMISCDNSEICTNKDEVKKVIKNLSAKNGK
ncbi:MAG: NUDIX domain-containing protein [Clostridia bacterium]|nr:NUDIX domain-containing protein [Clostridia bacterium]